MPNDDKQPIPATLADVKHAPVEKLITGAEINALIKSEQYAETIKLTDKVLANKGLYDNIFLTNARYVRGRCFFEMQQYSAAYSAFSRCLLKPIYFLNPLKPVDAHYHCGLIAAQNKLYQQAITHFSLAKNYKDSHQQKMQAVANRDAAKLSDKLKKEVQRQLDTFKYKFELIKSLLNKIIRIQTKSQDYLNAFKYIYGLLTVVPDNARAQKQLFGIIDKLTPTQLDTLVKNYFCDSILNIGFLLQMLNDAGCSNKAKQILLIFVKLNPTHELAATVIPVPVKATDEKTDNISATMLAESMAKGTSAVLQSPAATPTVVLDKSVAHTSTALGFNGTSLCL